MDIKQTNLTLVLLLRAALMEAGGDALVRLGLHASSTLARMGLFIIGAVVLFSYGYLVNSPPWDFGRLLGVYVVFFFVVAQVISAVFFKQPPGFAVILGGAFVIIGGLIMSLA